MTRSTDTQVVHTHFTVAHALMRADAVYIAMIAPGERADLDSIRATMGFVNARNTPELVIIHGVTLYLALAYTAIVTWQGHNTGVSLSDPSVDAELAKLDLTVLREFRNSIFHPKKIRDRREVAIIENAQLIPSVLQATAVMRAYFQRYFAERVQTHIDNTGQDES